MAVFVGGTGSANQLDDYEEGTFSPKLGPHNNHSIYENGTGKYTKIGDSITYTMSWQNKNATTFPTNARIEIWNLPFTFKHANSAGEHQVLSALMMHNVLFASNEKHYFYSIENGSYMYGLKSRDGNTWIEWGTADWNQSSLYFNCTGSFFVN